MSSSFQSLRPKLKRSAVSYASSRTSPIRAEPA
jgi:hypothetical protein